jgi:hypothetical protein
VFSLALANVGPALAGPASAAASFFLRRFQASFWWFFFFLLDRVKVPDLSMRQ